MTESLIRQAEAHIHRFSHGLAARENSIFVDTLEPFMRIESLGTRRDDLLDSLPRYQDDYTGGLCYSPHNWDMLYERQPVAHTPDAPADRRSK